MKDSFLDDSAVPQVLDDYSLEERWSDPGVPHPIRIHDDDRAGGAYAQARRFSPLHSGPSEQQALMLQEVGQ